ncbi:MAG TPA: succinate dehydrogenase cytochrome b subunit [Abditibacteriaceae bacterium]
MANVAGGKPGLVSITKKILMAVTGLLLCVFLVLHLLGNTLLLFGNVAFNNYAHILMTWPPLVYAMEIGLLALFLIHAYEGVVVYRGNKAARPQGYEQKHWTKEKSNASRKSVSSTTMIWTGIVILVFMFLHVGHFKFNKFWTIKEYETDVSGIALGVTGAGAAATESPAEAQHQMRDLYRLVHEEFHNPIVVVLYLLCMIALGLHLNHAIFSATQTLGANNKRWEKYIWFVGRAFTFIVAGGFFLLPILMWLRPLNPTP